MLAPNRCLCGAGRGAEGAVANQQSCRTAVSGYPPRGLGRQEPLVPPDRGGISLGPGGCGRCWCSETNVLLKKKINK